jgi:4-amino-4-deoxy-L-arabinose transferase-like glycosyltransferase
MVAWISLIPFEIYILFITILFFSFKEIRPIKINKKLILLFVIALVVRMSVLHTHLIYLDEPAYSVVGKNMLLYNKAAQDVYLGSTVDFKSTKTYPGWSFVLSIAYFLFGISDKVAINLTALIGSLTVFLVFILSKRLFMKESIALWSVFIFALLPLHVIWSAASDTIIFAIFLTLLLLIIRDKLLTALLFGFLIQTRPDYIFIFPLILLYWFLFDKIKILPFLVLIPIIPFYLYSLLSIPDSLQAGSYLEILSFTDTQFYRYSVLQILSL